jgi:VIT1/CCC1 family predicted Fe2+/Mn2+ transporter
MTESASTPSGIDSAARSGPRTRIARQEPQHRTDRSGALRAGVFGVNDGLVSNTALVMGVAGSGSAHRVILLSGVAGLLAGSVSMAAGEYVSMASQREMYEREIALEARELEERPEDKRNKLVRLYQAKGLERADAKRVADRIMADPSVALDTLAREDLGLDPNGLGSPVAAAVASKMTFGAGALAVILPYFIGDGTAAFIGAIALAAAALLGVGASIGKLNGRSAVRSGLRQLLLGATAALVTFCVGHLIGAGVS